MSVTGNFTTVTLGPDDNGDELLTVNGVTVGDNGGDVDDVKAVYVAVAHGAAKTRLLGASHPDQPQGLPSVAVPAPEGAGGWTATLAQANPPYAVGEMVLLVGVMVDTDDVPSFWHETLAIKPG